MPAAEEIPRGFKLTANASSILVPTAAGITVILTSVVTNVFVTNTNGTAVYIVEAVDQINLNAIVLGDFIVHSVPATSETQYDILEHEWTGQHQGTAGNPLLVQWALAQGGGGASPPGNAFQMEVQGYFT
jgi:hypothetical protein